MGRGTAATWLSTTDGATYTADSYRKANRFRTIGDRLVADVAGAGAVIWSIDGVNWSEPVVVGNVDEPVTDLQNVSGVLGVAASGRTSGYERDTNVDPGDHRAGPSCRGTGVQ